MVNSVDLLVSGPGFAEGSFLSVSRYRVSPAQIMQLSVLYVDWQRCAPPVGSDFAVN